MEWGGEVNPPFNVINRLRHLPSHCLRQEPGEAGGQQAQGDEDNGRDGGVDVRQRRHCGGQGAADLGDEGGGTNAGGTDSGRHYLTWK